VCIHFAIDSQSYLAIPNIWDIAGVEIDFLWILVWCKEVVIFCYGFIKTHFCSYNKGFKLLYYLFAIDALLERYLHDLYFDILHVSRGPIFIEIHLIKVDLFFDTPALSPTFFKPFKA